jgi:hypothetical protein
MSRTTTQATALDSYREQSESIRAAITESKKLGARLIQLRVATALPGLVLIAFGVLDSSVGSWAWQLGLGLIVGFLAFATWYENLMWGVAKKELQLYGFGRLTARCERNWQKLDRIPAESECDAFVTDWTRDLDVFGDRSLHRWFSLAMTHTGTRSIAKWLTNWVEPSVIRLRQEAVQELSRNREWRLAYYEIACGSRDQKTNPEAIVEWCKRPKHFEGRAWLYWLTWIGPILIPIGLVILIASVVREAQLGQIVGLFVLLGGAALNLLLSMFVIGPVHDLFHRLGAANRELRTLLDWIDCAGKLKPTSPMLQGIVARLFDESRHAHQSIRDLQRLMSLAGMQRSPLFFVPYVVLQLLVLWDIRILMRLEKWKGRYEGDVEPWMQALGELEALSSAATIADEYPDWTYPEIGERGTLLSTIRAAHPLLKDSQRVPNDLQISESQRLLLVTGSNMAGKSTMLRCIGVNSLLARTGAPVCAERWTSESFQITTSIRVQDSLQDGVSFFMAELKRLRSVVDQANAESKPDGKRMLILLDEILQGTNSRERQIAVDSVLKRLIDLKAIVLASTHDLELASSDQMSRAAQVVHFREFFELVDGKQVMKFDYVMRPGVTPTTNALKLLELVGL